MHRAQTEKQHEYRQLADFDLLPAEESGGLEHTGPLLDRVITSDGTLLVAREPERFCTCQADTGVARDQLEVACLHSRVRLCKRESAHRQRLGLAAGIKNLVEEVAAD